MPEANKPKFRAISGDDSARHPNARKREFDPKQTAALEIHVKLNLVPRETVVSNRSIVKVGHRAVKLPGLEHFRNLNRLVHWDLLLEIRSRRWSQRPSSPSSSNRERARTRTSASIRPVSPQR